MTDKKKETLLRAALLMRTVAESGCQSFYEDGSPTPNRELHIEIAADLEALAADLTLINEGNIEQTSQPQVPAGWQLVPTEPNAEMAFAGAAEMKGRYAYQIYNGFLQPDEVVMHLCDNAKCCNPAHLAKGTQSQNIKDMYRRNRDKQRQARRKLTDEQVAQLRARYVPRQVTHAMLAVELGVHTSVVARAVKGTTYAAEIN